ncbi:MAG: hypothetical protein MI723_05465 [Caulobacterales bacterium]|nr:hypothetical protein [Caulobacterales bacterium]
MTPGVIFLTALALAAIAYVGHLALRWLHLAREAREEWTYRTVHRSAEMVGADERGFIRGYLREHGPVGATLAVTVVAVNAALTPATLAGLAGLWRAGWIAQGKPAMFSDTTLVWQFYMFFGLIAAWVLVAWLAARAFYARRAGPRRRGLRQRVRPSS